MNKPKLPWTAVPDEYDPVWFNVVDGDGELVVSLLPEEIARQIEMMASTYANEE